MRLDELALELALGDRQGRGDHRDESAGDRLRRRPAALERHGNGLHAGAVENDLRHQMRHAAGPAWPKLKWPGTVFDHATNSLKLLAGTLLATVQTSGVLAIAPTAS